MNQNNQNLSTVNQNNQKLSTVNQNNQNLSTVNQNNDLSTVNQNNEKLSTVNQNNQKLSTVNQDNQKLSTVNQDNQKLSTMNQDNQKLSTINQDNDVINIKLSETVSSLNEKNNDNQNKEIICNMNQEKEISDILENKDIKNITTSEKQDIWGDLKTNILSSYNYLCSESQNLNYDINNFKLKDFYLDALNEKNKRGYIENDCVNECFDSKDYKFEIYTKISDNDDIDP